MGLRQLLEQLLGAEPTLEWTFVEGRHGGPEVHHYRASDTSPYASEFYNGAGQAVDADGQVATDHRMFISPPSLEL